MYYEQLLKKYHWIIEEKQNTILSSDSDGMISGLLMSAFFDWNVVGYYDSETLLLRENFSVKDCVFLDVEIFREYAKSIGHHIILFDVNSKPNDFINKTINCINPNLLRGYDKKTKYTSKYPFGTLHLLLRIIKEFDPNLVRINDRGVPALLFIDGVWNTFTKYHQNVLNWIKYLDMEGCIWWKKITSYSFIELKKELDDFISKMRIINGNRKWYGHLNLNAFDANILFDFLDMCSEDLGWKFNKNHWKIHDLKKYRFNRHFINLNTQKDFDIFWNKNPFSMSTYYRNKISYTIEEPDKLP
ncbi:MAG: hypothetical protein A7315_08755 [Candidatus Altiarchaeales archaeon WOR_SM1_79]|nr:MAG: hypothetical protein A7315_08755 [Candidatus Altiarchaeales archaeon WOR_SM1_79]